jgi:glycosyltransferase involved in cell wall biosynthesis
MKILVLSQYFHPESFRINEIVSSLTDKGHDVVVLTGKPNYPEGFLYRGYSALNIQKEFFGGARIFRVPIVTRGYKNPVRLAANYLSFVLSATVLGTWILKKEKFDAIFCYAPSPLIQALAAIWLGWVKKAPVVLHVQDLWPESLEATGYIKNTLILRIVKHIVRFIYQHTDKILVSSFPFKEKIKEFHPDLDPVYYPNSVDTSFCNPKSGDQPVVDFFNSKFTVVFAGNIGSAQSIKTIVSAANILKKQSDIKFIIFGSGSELLWLKQKKIELSLDNLYIAGRYPITAMPFLLAQASALLVTLADQEIFSLTVPNKIQAYMAVGRPIIACMNGEGTRLVQEANAGLTAPAEDAQALAEQILYMSRLPENELETMAKNSSRYYWANFNHDLLVDRLIQYCRQAKDANL